MAYELKSDLWASKFSLKSKSTNAEKISLNVNPTTASHYVTFFQIYTSQNSWPHTQDSS